MAINTSIVQDIAAAQVSGSTAVSGKKNEYGRTIGEPKLSEEGKKYYDELKNKFKGYDFILVSKDQIENAKSQAARYANPMKPGRCCRCCSYRQTRRSACRTSR